MIDQTGTLGTLGGQGFQGFQGFQESQESHGRDSCRDACPHCGVVGQLHTVLTPDGPHHARTGCSGCGRFVRWEPAPMTPERARAFALPFGKYTGTTLGEMLAIDPAYLRWLAGRDNLKPGLRRALDQILGGQP
jgi:uncharacterized protein (DUF3820 family)